MIKYKELILNIINNSCDHLSVMEIFYRAKEKMPDIVLSTIYNNVNSLVSEGLIRRISTGSNKDRYDKIEKHDHLICKICGSIKDINLSDYTPSISKDLNKEINGYNLEVFYICDNCKNKYKGEILK